LKKYPKNHFGFSHLLDGTHDDQIYMLEKSVMNEVKNRPELSNIKSVKFSFEGEDKTRLECTVNLRDGRTITREFTSYVDEGAIHFCDYEAAAYFGFDKYNEVEKFFEDGPLEHDFLSVHEPDLCEQLRKGYMLSSTPNTENGSEFTESDLEFFLGLLNESDVA
jgi:hypothetical protein